MLSEIINFGYLQFCEALRALSENNLYINAS